MREELTSAAQASTASASATSASVETTTVALIIIIVACFGGILWIGATFPFHTLRYKAANWLAICALVLVILFATHKLHGAM